MLDSIYHMTLKLLLNHVFFFCVKNAMILPYILNIITDIIYHYIVLPKSVNH